MSAVDANGRTIWIADAHWLGRVWFISPITTENEFWNAREGDTANNCYGANPFPSRRSKRQKSKTVSKGSNSTRMKHGPVKRQWTRPHREALSKHSAPMTPRDAVHKTVLQMGDTAQPIANANHGRHQKRKPLIPLQSRSRCEAPRRSVFLIVV